MGGLEMSKNPVSSARNFPHVSQLITSLTNRPLIAVTPTQITNQQF